MVSQYITAIHVYWPLRSLEPFHTMKFKFIQLYKRLLLIIITLGVNKNNVEAITHLLYGNGTVTCFNDTEYGIHLKT